MLGTALCHASYANGHGEIQSNERLEFFGDAVLGLVVNSEVPHLAKALQVVQGRVHWVLRLVAY